MSFTVYPAIDVRAGRVVRLAQGDFTREKRYPDEPLALACRYAEQGARWLHLVDMDAFGTGRYTLHGLLGRIRERTGLQVQTGGGIRTEADVQGVLDAGASRAVIGTLAVHAPGLVRGWLASYGAESVCLALDARRHPGGHWRLAVHGWMQDTGVGLHECLQAYAGSPLRHVLCTDIGRDGMLQGPNLALYEDLATRWPQLEIQASGGVSALEDVAATRRAGAAGAVLGRALLEGRVSLPQVLAC
ncbi:MAG TPA: HisA/HisF-related TIM barrel protein [Xanthomonadaceae bacterium]|nr:HisA/HisF-related TIM barrel protein [Xanthomonadaceae bacterium]